MADQYGYGAGQNQSHYGGDWQQQQQGYGGYDQQSQDPNAHTAQDPNAYGGANGAYGGYDYSGQGQAAGNQDPNQYSQTEDGEYQYSAAPDAYPDRRPDLVDQDAAEDTPRQSLTATLNFEEPDNEKNIVRDSDGRPKAVSFAKLITLLTHPKEPGMISP